jgi:hypothetical protein
MHSAMVAMRKKMKITDHDLKTEIESFFPSSFSTQQDAYVVDVFTEKYIESSPMKKKNETPAIIMKIK